VHRGHRVPAIPGAELDGQLAEPGRHHAWVLGGELPGYPDLAQLAVGVLHRHAGLARAAQPAQGHHPRAGAFTSGQAGTQLGQQFLPPGQERRPRRQPQHRARRPAIGPVSRRPVAQLVQLGLDPGAQPQDQPHLVAELGRADLAGNLLPER